MASLSGNNTFKLWTCCKCKDTGISMIFGDCTQCDHPRCYDCDVKSHLASDDEVKEEDKKVQASRAMRPGSNPVSSLAESSSFERRAKMQDDTEASYSLASPLGPSEPPAAVSREGYPSSTGFDAMAMPNRPIPIASGIEHYSIFVLRENTDARLIAYWNWAIPYVNQRCLDALPGFGSALVIGTRLTSLHLFRVGTNESQSQPTVIVNTTKSLSEDKRNELQTIISTSGIGYFNVRLLFKESCLRRSVESPSMALPPICEPRNRHFSQTPSSGASIGIAESFEDTATLGCYLLVDHVPMILTVNHLVPDLGHIPSITHVSEQDRLEMMLPFINAELRSLLTNTSHQCHLCSHFQYAQNLDEEIYKFSMLHLRPDLDTSAYNICPLYQVLSVGYKSDERYQVHRIGQLSARSGPGFRMISDGNREMDWALFDIRVPSSLNLFQQILSRHEHSLLGSQNELRVLHKLKPGALVRSFGRTSGHQSGQVSNTISAVFHGGYVTQEWCVIKRPESPLEEWIEGGIGVEGDSGALIFDEESDAVYGMLWGRSGDGPATVTLFTPMTDILDDIRRKTGAVHVDFLGGQEIPRPGKGAAEALSQESESVPIKMSNVEKGKQPCLEEVMFSLDIQHQSSADMRHPHSFERYRGRDVTFRNTPRSLAPAQNSSEKVEGIQWPGGHTYLRYALAPEQE